MDELRDQIAKALYEEDAWPDRDWEELREERRVGWRDDADRAIKLVRQWIGAGKAIEPLAADPPLILADFGTGEVT